MGSLIIQTGVYRRTHWDRKASEATRISELWYPRPTCLERVESNPEVAERVFQLLEYGYSIDDLRDWFRLDIVSRDATNTPEANEIWEDIKASYSYRCAYCGKKSEHLTKDHIIAVSRQGNDSMDNVVPACLACNSSKNAINLLDWKKFHRLQLHLLGFTNTNQ